MYQDVIIVGAGRLAGKKGRPRVLRLSQVIGIFNRQAHYPVQNGGRI